MSVSGNSHSVNVGDQRKKPHQNKFQQQKLDVQRPVITPRMVILTFLVVGVTFIPLGAVILTTHNSISQQTFAYADACKAAGFGIGDLCRVSFTVDQDMDAPVYVYYELTNFFQNHRRYVKSRSDPQLRGDTRDVADCDPLRRYGDGDGKLPGLSNRKLYPCGLVANSYFRDNFTASLTRGATTTQLDGRNWQKKGIAWKTDRDDRFKDKPVRSDETRVSPFGDFRLPNVDDEDLIVWMRSATSSRFTKLYRQILDMDLKSGDVLTFDIHLLFDEESFDGDKRLVLGQATWLGGRNMFLGAAYLTMGCVSLATAFVFFYVTFRQLKYMHEKETGIERLDSSSEVSN